MTSTTVRFYRKPKWATTVTRKPNIMYTNIEHHDEVEDPGVAQKEFDKNKIQQIFSKSLW